MNDVQLAELEARVERLDEEIKRFRIHMRDAFDELLDAIRTPFGVADREDLRDRAPAT